MQTIRWVSLAALILGISGSGLQAADVAVKGVHVCCGSCVTAIDDTLGAVKGVSGAAADQNTKTVSFKAEDEKAAKAGLEALAKAGFHGTATLDKKEIKFPSADVKKGTKSNIVTVTGVHLCCGACVTGVKKALENVKGVAKMDIDREGKSVTATGTDIDTAEFLDALYKGGYHGELKKTKS